MNPLWMAFRTTLRSLLRPSRFLGLSLTTLLLLLFLLLPVPGNEGSLFASRVEILRVCLLFPGILVALELRRAWPALGPEDEAQVWLHLTGCAAWPSRLGAALGALASLAALLAFQALVFGLALTFLPDRPDFFRAASLTPRSISYLVHPGDHETFDLPGALSTRRKARALLLKPIWSMGPESPIEIEIFLGDAKGRWKSLGRTRFRGPGEAQRLSLDADLAEARQLQLRRLSPAGTLISFNLGEVLLLGPQVGWVLTGFRAAAPYLPWAVLLLLAGLSLCALLSPALWGLAVLALIPLIGLTPGLALDPTGPHLGQGLSSLPPSPGSLAILVALTLLAFGLFVPRRIRQPELDA